MSVKRVDIGPHRDFDGSVEDINGQLPAADQELDSSELTQLPAAINDHADWIEGQILLQTSQSLAGNVFSSANLLDSYTPKTQVFNGAVADPHGITIPAGSTGVDSYFVWGLDLSSRLPGDIITMTALLTTSEAIEAKYGNFRVFIGSSTSASGSVEIDGSASYERVSDTVLKISADYAVIGNEIDDYGIALQIIAPPSGTLEERYFAATDLRILSQTNSRALNYLRNELVKQYAAQNTLTAPKEAYPVVTTGEANTGALFYDGSSSDGAVKESGGWIIPAGNSGNTTFNRYRFAISDARPEGQLVRFLVVLNTSGNVLSSIIRFSCDVAVTGTLGSVTNKAYYDAESGGKIYFSFDYEFTGDETEVNAYLQVVNVTAVPADVWVHLHSSYMVPLGVDEIYGLQNQFNDWLENAYKEDSQTQAIRNRTLTALKESYPVLTAGQANTGALFYDGISSDDADSTSGGWLIPVDRSGNTTFNRYRFLFSTPNRAGKKIRLLVVLDVSDGILEAILRFSATQLLVTGTEGEATNQMYYMVENQLYFSVDYVCTGDETEISTYLQVVNVTAVTADVWVHAKGQYIIPLDINDIYTLQNTLKSPEITAAISNNTLKSENFISNYVAKSQVFNGAIIDGDGLNVPAGSTGLNSYIVWGIDVSGFDADSTVTMTALLTTTAEIENRYSNFRIFVASATTASSAVEVSGSKSIARVSDTVLQISADYVVTGVEVGEYGLGVQLLASANGTSDERYFEATDLRVALASNTEMLNYKLKALEKSVTEPLPGKVVTVDPSGGGDYLTPKEACLAETGGQANSFLTINILPGIYTDVDFYTLPYTLMQGIGRREEIWIKGELPDDVSPIGLTASTETIWFNHTGIIKNLKITAKNMRYPVHSDSGPSDLNAILIIDNCLIEHYGNDGALAHYVSIGGNPNTPWGSTTGFGCGTHSGQHIMFINGTVLRSPTAPVSIHTNKDFALPCRIDIEDTSLECTDAEGFALRLASMGTGQSDTVNVKNSNLSGEVRYNDYQWLSQIDRTLRQGNHNEIVLTISGAPVAVVATTLSESLVFRLAETNGYAINVSGDAAAVLFGDAVVRTGSNGLQSAVVSQENVGTSSGGVLLQSRLGDCTVTSKTLTLDFNATTVNLTLDADYSAMDNAAIVADINNRLPADTGVFTTEMYWAGRGSVRQTQHDVYLLNTGSTAIRKGQPAAFDGSYKRLRLMSSEDEVVLFAGIAMDDINVGQYGLVSKRNFFDSSFEAPLNGDFGVTAKVGENSALVIGQNKPILRCIDAGRSIWRCILGNEEVNVAGIDPVAPAISGIGYAGHTLTAAGHAGAIQWYANDVAINGETSDTYLIADEHHGAAFSCKATSSGITATSNIIHHYTADDAPLALQLEAWDATAITQAASKISQWSDQSGNDRHLVQSSEPAKATYGSGVVAMTDVSQWDKVSIEFDTFIIVGTFDAGSSTFDKYYRVFEETPSSNRILTQISTSNLYDSNSATHVAKINGATVAQQSILPMVDDIVQFDFASIDANMSLLCSHGFTDRGLVGEYKGVFAFSGANVSDMQKLVGYLAHMHSITLDAAHPYYAAPPVVGE